MSITVDDYYEARADVAPFASGDADVLEDIDFSLYTSDAEFNAAHLADGWTINGTLDWDANGVQMQAASSINNTTWAHQAALLAANEGSITFEVERAGLTVNEADIAANFIQSSGRVGQAAAAQLFVFTGAPWNNTIGFYRDTSGQAGQCITNIGDPTGGNKNPQTYINSSRKVNVTDTEYAIATITVTWKGRTVQTIFDGLPVATETMGQDFSATVFLQQVIGNSSATGANFFGPYSIKRMQIAKRQSLLVANPMRICFGPGDSFLASFTDSVNIDSLADIKQLSDGTGGAGSANGLAEFIRLFAVNHSMALTSITGFHDETASMNGSTENGAGFATEGYTFSSEMTDYIIARNPEILITAGSWNDVNDSSPVADIYGDTKTILDTIIDGCRGLRQIHFFAQFPGFKGATSTDTDAHRAEAARLRLLQSALDGYQRVNATGVEVVTVFFHNTYDLFGGDDYSVELTIGSATGNIANPLADQHPSSQGLLKMAEIIYDATEPYIATVPVLFE